MQEAMKAGEKDISIRMNRAERRARDQRRREGVGDAERKPLKRTKSKRRLRMRGPAYAHRGK